ncbi:heme-binding protein [Bombella sp. ESL0378]|uniref:GlcG/HbpS family heme-binding protein n=1 Tax=unclassified Bombella TaxID=2644098 RepID=UPI0012D9934E|nr:MULTISPECIES: heme-binding protein [unclassified Bombella]MCT6855382.1 heme-binding protein [Bombella apis]MUG05182.1 heme-binding protein [Bombella sp. ESL0378]MUG90729.1 heme-binding protein [Bombella sp. ESL0385]
MPVKYQQETAQITWEAAQALIEAVLKEGAAQKIAFSIAVMDAGGHLRAFGRADEAAFLTAEIACDKAWTACSFGQPTHIWNSLVQESHMAPLASHPRLMAVGGGYPIFYQGRLIGGLGVSGGTYEQDQEAAVKALSFTGFDKL